MSINFKDTKITIKLTTISGDKYELINQELQGDLISLHTEKGIKDVAGSWNMKLVARDNLQWIYNVFNREAIINFSKKANAYQIFRPMGIVDVYINNSEVMIGIIDTVRKTVSMSTAGKPERIFLIQGRDMGALLIDNKIWYDKNPNIQNERAKFQHELVSGLIFKEGLFSGGKIYKMLENIYDIWFTKILENVAIDEFYVQNGKKTSRIVGNFRFSNGSSISEMISCRYGFGWGLSSQVYLDEYPASFEPWNYQGDIFQFLKSFSGAPFNELFIETGGADVTLNNFVGDGITPLVKGRAHVIFRPTPYDDYQIETLPNLTTKLDIHDLQEHKISDENIIRKDLTFGRNDVYTMFLAWNSQGLIGQTNTKYFGYPNYDERNLKRYGFRPLEVRMDSFDINNEIVTQNLQQMCENYRDKLRMWFRNNDKYLTGSFEIMGDETIRIGRKLVYGVTEDGKIEDDFERGYYYITRVTHDYVYGKQFKTSLQVERGVSYQMLDEMKVG